MAENVGLLILGGVAVLGVLWISGALCQPDIMNGALCPPGKGVWATSGGDQGAKHWQGNAPGQSGILRRRAIAAGGGGYSDDGYGDYDSGYESNAAHISIA